MPSTTGAQALTATLEHEGVEVIFGIPGGAVLPLFDPLLDSSIQVIGARHEQGAGHMAEGYAQATGEVGVVLATSGPGATNLVTPLLDALFDSVPLVAITGQVASHAIGTDAFQEAPTTDVARPCSKAVFLVTDPDAIAATVRQAFHLARSGRPGPVLVDVPKDVLAAVTEVASSPTPVSEEADLPLGDVARAHALLEGAERPVLLAGGGVIVSNAHRELLSYVEATNVPVVTTLKGRGAFPDRHRLALGMPGMHGVFAATTALQKADLLISVGARFDDRVTANPDTFAPNAKVVHIDIDPQEIGKVRSPEVGLVGDARAVLRALLAEWGERQTPDRSEWHGIILSWQRRHPLDYDQDPAGPIKPQFVIEALHRLTGGDTTVVTGVGQHQMWTSQLWQFEGPRSLITSGGLGTMGFAVPAAIGAKVARPDQLVYAIDGDGSFQMTSQELATAAAHGIPIKVALLNNGGYGMVRQWQDLFYRGRRSGVDLGASLPDFAGLAQSMGCVGLRVESPDEVEAAVEKTLTIDDLPVVVDFVVDPDEMVFPMVVAGGSNDEIALSPADLG